MTLDHEYLDRGCRGQEKRKLILFTDESLIQLQPQIRFKTNRLDLNQEMKSQYSKCQRTQLKSWSQE